MPFLLFFLSFEVKCTGDEVGKAYLDWVNCLNFVILIFISIWKGVILNMASTEWMIKLDILSKSVFETKEVLSHYNKFFIWKLFFIITLQHWPYMLSNVESVNHWIFLLRDLQIEIWFSFSGWFALCHMVWDAVPLYFDVVGGPSELWKWKQMIVRVIIFIGGKTLHLLEIWFHATN
jgi:hypothetical protein